MNLWRRKETRMTEVWLMLGAVVVTGAGGIVAACYHIRRGHACTLSRTLKAFGPWMVAQVVFFVVLAGAW